MKATDFNKEFLALVNQSERVLKTVPRDKSRDGELHPSSFPYCALRHAYENLHGKPEEQDVSFSSDLFLTVGTTIHQIFQDWLSKAPNQIKKKERQFKVEVLGNWKCSNSKCKKRRFLKPYKECPKCKSEMLYQEIPLDWDPIHGHIDLVLKMGNYYMPVDLKSVNSLRLLSYRTNPALSSLPSLKHKKQIEAYSFLFEKLYKKRLGGKCKVVGWLLYYISRDDPLHINQSFTYKLSDAEKDRIKKEIIGYKKYFVLAEKAKKFADFKPLVQAKPCDSKEFYMKNYHDQYSPCPLGMSGKCFIKKKLAETIKKTIKETK